MILIDISFLLLTGCKQATRMCSQMALMNIPGQVGLGPVILSAAKNPHVARRTGRMRILRCAQNDN